MKAYRLNWENPMDDIHDHNYLIPADSISSRKPKFQWRQQYDEDRDAIEGDMAATSTPDNPERDLAYTQQHYRDEVDINVMLKRMGVTDGAIAPAATDPAYFGPIMQQPPSDLREILDIARDAQRRFNDLPAELRKRFGNDPAYLHDWVHKPENFDEAVRLGLLTQEAPAAPPTEAPKTPAAPPTETPKKDSVSPST